MSVTFSQDMFSGLAPVKPYCFPHSFDLQFIFRGFISVSNQTCTFYSGFSPTDAGCHVEIILYYNQHDLCNNALFNMFNINILTVSTM